MDIMARATIIGSESFRFIEIYTDAFIVYVGIAIVLFALFALLEHTLKKMVPIAA